ncbi:class II fumarate hydratase [Ectothiorhodospira lacustris]|uniref:class II fumarate hydratase n=1 Tax=Ectothiorhodospira lacustris TaxID=2899127 RepID=UPI001EE97313|nr:class II fumarate hydratase [Ectothiorhodospira lacustris]MCG5510188.1 class II fumarate hydratase [Ectothiorhodospira lacustris]MCG5522031.1 class II fumarate hydratase [Ectothiorhodospira lacustris]
MGNSGMRVEHDSMGPVEVPAKALYGAQTQRAVNHFRISGRPMPAAFVQALGHVKAACAQANRDLGLLSDEMADAIIVAADAVSRGEHAEQFPVDVFQTGSGTSSNMNANEVIATLASRHLGTLVHPNDHVNLGQSSNDVIPTALHVAAALALRQRLIPAVLELAECIDRRAADFSGLVKTGRTHLMDAMPVRLDQELGAWAQQMRYGAERLEDGFPRLVELAIGGTAVGTGVNAHPELGDRVARILSRRTGVVFVTKPSRFEGLAAQDTAVEISGQLKTLAVSLMKICNDLRWMNSGPLAGLGEIRLPALQPGSSIMPGKVNPVVPEAVAMICARVMGNDVTIGIAGQSGNFQLNVMLPLIAHDLLESIELLYRGVVLLREKAVEGLMVDESRLRAALERNPILVTALNPVIGYEQGAAIAKRAYGEGRPVLAVALEMTGLDEATLRRLLDPMRLTGIAEEDSGRKT